MDPELMALFANARATGNNRNVSSVLNNLDNPLLAFLAGAYTPPVRDVSAVMPLTQKYSQMDDPFVRKILDQIATGADEYTLRSFVTNMTAAEDVQPELADAGWQPADLQGLAVALLKEQTEAGKTGDSWWQKAGLADPSAQYDETNVPLPADIRKKMEEMLPQVRAYTERQQSATMEADTAAKEYERRKKERKEVKETPKYRTSDLIRGGAFAPENLEEAKAKRAKSLGIGGGSKNAEDELQKAYLKMSSARQRKMDADFNAAGAQKVAEAYAKGVAKAYQEAGRTPTRDQLASIMRFLNSGA